MDAYAGIDVAFAKKKFLPVSVCVWRDGVLEPLPLRSKSAPIPPRGSGNAKILDNATVKNFAESTAQYLRDVENAFGVTVRRIAIDAPSDPKINGCRRRDAEIGLDQKRISCITTPDIQQFHDIRAKALAHLANGGEESRLPHANQLWMLVGFELFRRLRLEWECLEVFPQAMAAALGAASIHKSNAEGLQRQLSAAARFTGWPEVPCKSCLADIGYGMHHDNLDAYLAAWVASLNVEDREAIGTPPSDVIWVPRLTPEPNISIRPAVCHQEYSQTEPIEHFNRLLTFARHLSWADLLRTQFEAEMEAEPSPEELSEVRKHEWRWFGLMCYWYASLYVVIEAWTELGFSDPIIDRLLAHPNDFKSLLRRYRNSVFHFGKSWIDPRIANFLNHDTHVHWIGALHNEIIVFFAKYLDRLESPDDQENPFHKMVEEAVNWLPYREAVAIDALVYTISSGRDILARNPDDGSPHRKDLESAMDSCDDTLLEGRKKWAALRKEILREAGIESER